MSRTSTHHPDRENRVSRKKERPVEKHAEDHFGDFLREGTLDTFNAFWGQFGNMTPKEKQMYYDNLEKNTGIKIRFY